MENQKDGDDDLVSVAFVKSCTRALFASSTQSITVRQTDVQIDRRYRHWYFFYGAAAAA